MMKKQMEIKPFLTKKNPNSLIARIRRTKILLISVLLAFPFMTNAAGAGEVQTPVVVVVKSIDFPQYDRTVDGFMEVLKHKYRKVILNIYYLNDPNLIRLIRSQGPDMILTLGTPATRFVFKGIPDIPIIFSMIMDPGGNGISSRVNAGASVDIPVKIQMEKLRMVMPRLKRVGVIYNPVENENTIREARKAASELGLTLKAYPVRSKREIPKMGDLDIDILWMIPDTMVSQPAIIRRFILTGLREKVPVMGYSRSYAKAGTLLAVSCDYKDIGRQSGEIAVRLFQGEEYSNLTISIPRKVKLYFNKIVADRLGIKLPKKIMKQADEVFGR
ncbi:MAG: hypothetical protein GY940_08215 [bacterium]|nr:hypothetical protein [bacterium]